MRTGGGGDVATAICLSCRKPLPQTHPPPRARTLPIQPLAPHPPRASRPALVSNTVGACLTHLQPPTRATVASGWAGPGRAGTALCPGGLRPPPPPPPLAWMSAPWLQAMAVPNGRDVTSSDDPSSRAPIAFPDFRLFDSAQDILDHNKCAARQPALSACRRAPATAQGWPALPRRRVPQAHHQGDQGQPRVPDAGGARPQLLPHQGAEHQHRGGASQRSSARAAARRASAKPAAAACCGNLRCVASQVMRAYRSIGDSFSQYMSQHPQPLQQPQQPNQQGDGDNNTSAAAVPQAPPPA